MEAATSCYSPGYRQKHASLKPFYPASRLLARDIAHRRAAQTSPHYLSRIAPSPSHTHHTNMCLSTTPKFPVRQLRHATSSPVCGGQRSTNNEQNESMCIWYMSRSTYHGVHSVWRYSRLNCDSMRRKSQGDQKPTHSSQFMLPGTLPV